MDQGTVVDLTMRTLELALKIGLPLLLASLVVGLLVSVFQAVTQIQEQTLSFVPKLLAVSGAALVALPWMMQIMIKYTTELFRSFPMLAS